MEFWFPMSTPSRVLIGIGPVTIYWYSLCIVGGILASYALMQNRLKRFGLSREHISDIAFYAVVAGLIGARLWHVFVFQWGYYSAHPEEIIRIWEGGIAIQGAILFGALALFALARRLRLPFLHITDSVAVGLPLGQAIGRVGNFFNQELYGLPTNAPWAIYIDPEHRVTGYEQVERFHPAFAYEAFLNLLLCGVLVFIGKKKMPDGALTGSYLAGYGLIRFIVDFVRIDPMPMIGFLRASQIISAVLFAVGAAIIIRSYRSDRRARIAKAV